ncbi:MAG TPA: hypothetical protein VFK31_09540 [Rhodanobacteraceae bacterium]|nr:hypothetical protein [Rhodanobacteraceae bacterium]
MTRLYYCPVCHGDGEEVTYDNGDPQCLETRTCYTCDGDGYVPASVAWFHYPEHGAPQPYTPSHRRTQWGRGPRLGDQRDPLVKLHDARRDYRGKWGYTKARLDAIGKLSHTYAGLMQADMLARATMCGTAMEVARRTWRSA